MPISVSKLGLAAAQFGLDGMTSSPRGRSPEVEARDILNELLDKYTEHGTAQFVLPEGLEVEPINQHGNVLEIAALFGGPEKLREVVNELQTLLYAA